MNEHPQRFRLLGKRLGTREWMGLHLMTEGLDYQLVEPRIVEHLPEGEWLYNVIGEGHEYVHCKICFPLGGRHVDNRRTTA